MVYQLKIKIKTCRCKKATNKVDLYQRRGKIHAYQVVDFPATRNILKQEQSTLMLQ